MQNKNSSFDPGYLTVMRAESDRGAVLVAAAYIDDALEDLLVAYFVDDEKAIERLLTYPGPCSTLAARCDLAYCLGLVGKDVHTDIRTIIKIRNEFAHMRTGASFDRKEVAARCNDLTQSMRRAGTKMVGVKPRNLFPISAGSIILALVGVRNRVSHREEGPAFEDIKKPDMNPLGY